MGDVIDTRIVLADAAGIAEAARLIACGLPVAVPTETVYGLAADATDGTAVARIYAAKGRPAFNPLIVHVPDLDAARRIVIFDELALDLARRFWPGPLTLVLPRRDDCAVSTLASAGLRTVAVRVPAHPAMQSLLQACGRPLAAPSANPSGRISPTRAAHVLAGLAGRIPLILDAGPTMLGLESTIVGISDGEARLLRPGPLTPEDFEIPLAGASGGIEAPGQMESHYAPTKPVRLNATAPFAGEWMIGFGDVRGNANLSPSGDLIEAAARLFDLLHEAEAQPLAGIAIARVPEEGLGVAINDRLRRSAASQG